MIKMYGTKNWFTTVSHEPNTQNQKLVSEISEISRPANELLSHAPSHESAVFRLKLRLGFGSPVLFSLKLNILTH